MAEHLKFAILQIKNKPVKIRFETIGDSLWYHVDGETYCYQTEKLAYKRDSEKQNKQTEIRSPMPGKITKIMIKEQDLVEKNQTILVLEAMKMEYSIKASGKSTIKKILCKVGDQLTQDQLVIELEPM